MLIASNALAAFGADTNLRIQLMPRQKIYTDRYDQIFKIVQQIIAHPHDTLTVHDRCRAAVIMRYLYDDDDTVEYIYSTLTKEELKLVAEIRKIVSNKS
jgi:hypothetical protein